MQVEMRLALPVSELWDTYLLDHPDERMRYDAVTADDAMEPLHSGPSAAIVTREQPVAVSASSSHSAKPVSANTNDIFVTIKECSALQVCTCCLVVRLSGCGMVH